MFCLGTSICRRSGDRPSRPKYSKPVSVVVSRASPPHGLTHLTMKYPPFPDSWRPNWAHGRRIWLGLAVSTIPEPKIERGQTWARFRAALAAFQSAISGRSERGLANETSLQPRMATAAHCGVDSGRTKKSRDRQIADGPGSDDAPSRDQASAPAPVSIREALWALEETFALAGLGPFTSRSL